MAVLKELAWLVGEITLKLSCLCGESTVCVVDSSILGHYFKGTGLAGEITLKLTVCVDWSILVIFKGTVLVSWFNYFNAVMCLKKYYWDRDPRRCGRVSR